MGLADLTLAAPHEVSRHEDRLGKGNRPFEQGTAGQRGREITLVAAAARVYDDIGEVTLVRVNVTRWGIGRS